MSVLGKYEIEEALDRSLEDDPLIITPLLNRDQQVSAASVDLRLGHEFIILQRSSVKGIDPTDKDALQQGLHRTQRRVRISLHKELIIHPGQLVLGSTIEYLSIPQNIFASIEGRSSWGRLGLIIATASSIAPGFQGCITLEMVNAGEVPLSLYPGVRIAQLILHHTNAKTKYDGKYRCPTGPQFTNLHQDKEIALWGPQNS